MINFRVQGELDQLEFTENVLQPYKWENFQQLVKIVSYCFLYSCHKEKDSLDKFSRTNIFRFVDTIKTKLQNETQTTPWECMKYFFYPENEKVPTIASQNKMILRYFTVLLQFMITQHKLQNYLEYNSNFIRDQTIDLDDFDLWQNKLDREDYTILRNLFLSINTVSYTFYEYCIKRYQLNGMPGQIEYYNKLKTDLVMKVLFSEFKQEE